LVPFAAEMVSIGYCMLLGWFWLHQSSLMSSPPSNPSPIRHHRRRRHRR
jgi:hypothetical protein